jgi:uncharacterized membrane protein
MTSDRCNVRSHNADLRLVVGGVVLAVLAAALPPTPTVALQVVLAALALPLVLVYPGYAVVAAWGADIAPRDRRTAIPAVSIVCVILVGLALHAAEVLLSSRNWTVVLAVFTLGTCFVAARRRRAVPQGEHVQVSFCSVCQGADRPFRRSAVWYAMAAASIAGVVLVTAMRINARPGPRFTELWLEPTPNEGAFVVGVRNTEGVRTDYQLEVRAGGRVAARYPIRLADGDAWTTVMDGLGSVRPVEAVLSRGASDPVYRRVTLWKP